MELDVDPRRDDDASPTSSERMKVELFTKNDSRNTQLSIFFKIKFNFWVSMPYTVLVKTFLFMKLSNFSTSHNSI